LLLALTLMVGAPAAAAQLTPTVSHTLVGDVATAKLPNGLEVILLENHAAPVVSWFVYYKVGSRNEAVGWTGSTHLLEHMMFKGTKTLKKGQVAQLLARNGARFNANTWTDFTDYFETYSSDKLEMGLRLEADRMRNSLILDSERQSEMTVVRNEMERGESSPWRTLYEEVTSQAYKAHPYHHPVIGWRSDVENVPTSRLHAFYDTYYYPNNAVAVLVGDFKTPEALALIEKYFGAIAPNPHIPPMYTSEEPQEGPKRFTLHRRGETNLVQLAWHIPAVTHPDLAPLQVLETILGAGATSRLYQGLVEKQLASSADADCGTQRDPSLFRLSATLQPGVAHETVEKALDAEIETIKTTPVTPDELQKAQNQVEAGMILSSDGTEGLARQFGFYAATAGDWQYGLKLLDRIKHVTPEDLMRVAKTYFTVDNETVGYYKAEPEGPIHVIPKNAGAGRAVGSKAKVQPLPLLDFEKRAARPHALTKPEVRQLKNGLTLVVLDNPQSKTFALSGFVRTGDVHNPAGKWGLASMTADMLDKGSATRDKLAIARDLEQVGASVGFSGGTETTGISASGLVKDLDKTLDVLAEDLTTPAFPATELEKARAQWIASIKQNEDQPETRASRAFNHAIFPAGHPYYVPEPVERIQALQSLTPEDLKAFYAGHYGPNDTVITLVGPITADQAAVKLTARFERWPQLAAVPAETFPKVPAVQHPETVIPMMDKTNVAIYLGNASPITRDDPDYYAAALANYVLGGDPLTAKLAVTLRDEMGLTYDVRSRFTATWGAGPWISTITVNRANVPTALQEMRGLIGRFVKTGLSEGDLAKAKSTFIGSLAVGLSTNSGMAGSLADIEKYGLGLDYWSRYPTIIQGVTLEQANRALRRLIDMEHANLAIAGPYLYLKPPH